MKPINILPFLTLSTLFIGCSGGSKKLVSQTPEQVISDLNNELSITYESSLDRVTIEAKTSDGESTPITLLGTRINAEEINQDKAASICALLGFLSPERANYSVTKAETDVKLTSTVISGSTDAEFSKYVRYPVLHMDAILNSYTGLPFVYVPKVGSHYFNIPTFYQYSQDNSGDYMTLYNEYHEAVKYKSYLEKISCEGTSSLHYNNEGQLNTEDFLVDIFKGLSGAEISEQNSPYNMNIPFLVAAAEGNWFIEKENTSYGLEDSGDIFLKKDKTLLQKAEAGAIEICEQSGYTGLVHYELVYKNSDDINGNVYQYHTQTGWSEGLAPEKAELTAKKKSNYSGEQTKTIEVPSIYLGQVYCF